MFRYDGLPMLLSARSPANEPFLGVCTDEDGEVYGYLYARVSEDALQAVLRDLLPLRDAFLTSPQLLRATLDIDGGAQSPPIPVAVHDLDTRLLPEADATTDLVEPYRTKAIETAAANAARGAPPTPARSVRPPQAGGPDRTLTP
jgi:hypothetical protein